MLNELHKQQQPWKEILLTSGHMCYWDYFFTRQLHFHIIYNQVQKWALCYWCWICQFLNSYIILYQKNVPQGKSLKNERMPSSKSLYLFASWMCAVLQGVYLCVYVFLKEGLYPQRPESLIVTFTCVPESCVYESMCINGEWGSKKICVLVCVSVCDYSHLSVCLQCVCVCVCACVCVCVNFSREGIGRPV